MKKYFEILGINETASLEEVKSAYRKLALEHHPDRNHGNKEAEEMMKQINLAYEKVSDYVSRRYSEPQPKKKQAEQKSSFWENEIIKIKCMNPEERIPYFASLWARYAEATYLQLEEVSRIVCG